MTLPVDWKKVIPTRATDLIYDNDQAVILYNGSEIFRVCADHVVVNAGEHEHTGQWEKRINACFRYWQVPYTLKDFGTEFGLCVCPTNGENNIPMVDGVTLPYATTTETKQTANRWQTWLTSHNWKLFMSPAQTVIEVTPDGNMLFRYHGRILVTVDSSGMLTLDVPDDARTEPTRKRCNSFLRYIESVYSIIGSYENPKDWSVVSSIDKLCFRALVNGMTLSA